ncbi:sensor domain-containing protein [Nocardioides jensenii]|uniref:sensor domain-containing protein n=1 Tax=Nocardioides jensenii TaxID=1843 RepID=UPI00082CDAE7|nr:sensor domain-containing protein [Nocardioides jensenii]
MTSTIEMAETDTSRTPRPTWLHRIGLDTAYNLTALFFAIPAFVVVVTGMALGLSLLVLLFGIPVLAATAYAARGFAHVERSRIRALVPGNGSGADARTPPYLGQDPQASWLARAATPLRDPQSWFDLGWTLLSFVSSIAVFVVTVTWWALVLGGLSYWYWEQFIPFDDDSELLVEVLRLGEGRGAESLLMLGVGVLALLTVPLVVRVCALAQSGLGRLLLSSRAS